MKIKIFLFLLVAILIQVSGLIASKSFLSNKFIPPNPGLMNVTTYQFDYDNKKVFLKSDNDGVLRSGTVVDNNTIDTISYLSTDVLPYDIFINGSYDVPTPYTQNDSLFVENYLPAKVVIIEAMTGVVILDDSLDVRPESATNIRITSFDTTSTDPVSIAFKKFLNEDNFLMRPQYYKQIDMQLYIMKPIMIYLLSPSDEVLYFDVLQII